LQTWDGDAPLCSLPGPGGEVTTVDINPDVTDAVRSRMVARYIPRSPCQSLAHDIGEIMPDIVDAPTPPGRPLITNDGQDDAVVAIRTPLAVQQ
jgi:hypothetical protein